MVTLIVDSSGSYNRFRACSEQCALATAPTVVEAIAALAERYRWIMSLRGGDWIWVGLGFFTGYS